MDNCLELELSLSRRDRSTHSLEVRVDDPNSQILRAPERSVIRFHEDQLRDALLEPAKYGKLLFKDLFGAGSGTLQLFDEARAVAQNAGRPLRLRLFIHRDALELHDLRWETLHDERPNGGWLLTKESVLFSRFLSSAGWESAAPRAKNKLRTLVVIADPSDLPAGKFQDSGQTLAPVDVEGEKQRAQDGLGNLFVDAHVLASDKNQPGQVTLDQLRQRLREGFDIVYLVCHGALTTRGEKPGPQLLLEKTDGTGEFVAGSDLVEQVQNLAPELRPRLVVLAACQSAGNGGQPGEATADLRGALAALGPQLAQAGIPAVLAMQGSVTMNTVAGFMPTFFKELLKDGQIDRAMAVARSAVSQRPDGWMPVLFLRLRDGSLWYTPHFGGQNPDLIWGRILTGIDDDGKLMPVLGPGLSEHLCGTLREVARRWAEAENYPLAEHTREELPQVAQYLANRDGTASPRKSLLEHFRKQIEANFAGKLPPGISAASLEERLHAQIAAIATMRKDEIENDAYSLLARLPFYVYINTNPDNLLVQALGEAGKQPVVDFARWNPRLMNFQKYPSPYEQAREKNYVPDAQHPLVYHLFGALRVRDSLILSEDDFFDYLMWVNQAQPQLPGPVGSALSEKGLVFLGFGLQDWNFRVLFRSILTDERRRLPREYKSVAVQVRPGENSMNPELARIYLEQYFGGMDISVYWGSVRDFIKELHDRAQKKGLL